MDDMARPEPPMTEDRAAQGVEHLQAAVLEMISAARAFLDVVEDVVSDPEKVAEVVSVVESVADAAVRAAGAGPGVTGPERPAGDSPSRNRSGRAPVETIRVG
jgi:hypothetical protein